MTVEVEITNFQNIQKLRINLRGFCAVVGRSNIGKSSIARAIACVADNPPANSFIRIGCREARVKLTFPEHKKSVEWIRNIDDGASYILSDLDDSGKVVNTTTLNKFGRSVPEPIQKLKFLKLFSEQWQASIGLAPQHQYFFLLDNPKLLVDLAGELKDVATLNQALREAGSLRRKAQDDARHFERLVQSSEAAKRSFEGSEKLRPALEDLQRQISDWNSKNLELESLRKLKSNLDSTGSQLQDATSRLSIVEAFLLDVNPIIQSAGTSILTLSAQELEFQNLKQLSGKIDRTSFQIQSLLPAVDFEFPKIPDVGELTELRVLRRKFLATVKSLESLDGILQNLTIPTIDLTTLSDLKDLRALEADFAQIMNQARRVNESQQDLDKILQQVELRISELKKKNPLCPICDRKWELHNG